MRHSDDKALYDELEAVLPYIPNGNLIAGRLNDTTRAQLLKAMPGLKERAKTLIELADSAAFLFADRPLEPDAKAAALLTPETRQLIGELHDVLKGVEHWSAETTEAAIRDMAEKRGAKLGQLAQPLRVSLTGRTTSPGIFDVLDVLGKDESLARLKDQAQAQSA
jgi:glutamyl-tRNA synthetase